MLVLFTCYMLLHAIRGRSQLLALLLGTILGTHAAGQVAFDVNASAAVRPLCAHTAFSRAPNSRLVAVELDVSTFFQPGTEQTIKEVMVQAVCRREEVVVVDYSPRTELHSDIDGPLQVMQEKDQTRDANLQGFGAYPAIGGLSGAWNQSDYQTQSVQFLQRPARELTVASGTIQRQRGVYFKWRPNSQTTLEGSRTLGILLSVPENWRADLMDVTLQAVGMEPPHFRRESVIARQSLVVALYQENDTVASQAAAEYVRQQANLIRSVKLYSKTIQQRNFPTPFHKLGAKLELYEPEVPDDWLESIVYKPGAFHHTRLSALPVDVRVAIMNFQDQKVRMETLSGAQPRIGSGLHPRPANPANPANPSNPSQSYTLGYRPGVQSPSNR